MHPAHKTKDSSTLSISSPGIRDCHEVAEYFRQCRISCHVKANETVLSSDDTDAYRIEHGCQIKFGSHATTLLTPTFWHALQHRFALTCAHLEVEGNTRGVCTTTSGVRSARTARVGAAWSARARSTLRLLRTRSGSRSLRREQFEFSAIGCKWTRRTCYRTVSTWWVGLLDRSGKFIV